MDRNDDGFMTLMNLLLRQWKNTVLFNKHKLLIDLSIFNGNRLLVIFRLLLK